jgi:ABC-type branched-subunit amino acid transport system substrate-binding protein
MDGFEHGFVSEGGVIVQQQWPDPAETDFSSYLAGLDPADTCVAWFDGSTSIQFLTQYHDLGIRSQMPLTACFHGSFFAPFILELLPEAAGNATVGEYCPTPYTPVLDTAVNNAFVAAWEAAIGEAPEDTDTGPYGGFLAVKAALEATDGDTTPEVLRDALLDVDIEGPEGDIVFDPGTKCALKTIYVCEVAKDGLEFYWEPAKAYINVPPMGYGFGGP